MNLPIASLGWFSSNLEFLGSLFFISSLTLGNSVFFGVFFMNFLVFLSLGCFSSKSEIIGSLIFLMFGLFGSSVGSVLSLLS